MIEQELGFTLEWNRLNDKKSCRIAILRDSNIYDDEEALQEIREWMIQNLPKFIPHQRLSKPKILNH